MKNLINYSIPNLFLTIPNTDLIRIIEESINVLNNYPGILDKIFNDQEKLAKQKKELRLEDKIYFLNKNEDIPGLNISDTNEITPQHLELQTGRPRMNPQTLYLFIITRGYYGSVTDKDAVNNMTDSMTLKIILDGWNIKMPGSTTILENLNCISNETREFILAAQIKYTISEKLDDFKNILVDSTSIKGNTSWPTDSKILFSLLNRAYNYSQKLSVFGISNFNPFWMPGWLKKIKKLIFKIALTSGKANSKGKIKKYYRHLLKIAEKALDYMVSEIEKANDYIVKVDIAPSLKKQLNAFWRIITDDIMACGRVLYYTENRVFNEVVLSSTEKILSISDRTAAFIKKGNRNPVIGYKPQISRSENGFIPAIKLPLGNASDSKELMPIVKKVVGNTNIIPNLLNVDDGYASRDNVEKAKQMGIKIISISGSKGKKITVLEDWNSDEYKKARADRSAVESIMFTLKYSYDFGVVRRRGIENVKAELLEKVIVYNFARIILLREREKQKLRL